MSQLHLFGTSPHKLARKNGPVTSKQAAGLVDTITWEERIYGVILQFPDGCIQDDVLSAIHESYGYIPYSTVTARFKALQDKGLIVYTDETRSGMSGRQSRVRIATKYLKGAQLGHANTNVTKRYAHLTKEHLRDEVKKLG